MDVDQIGAFGKGKGGEGKGEKGEGKHNYQRATDSNNWQTSIGKGNDYNSAQNYSNEG